MMFTKIKPMLAADLQPKDFDKLQFPLIVQPKLDGIRCIIHPELGPVTRTLKPIPNKYIRDKLSEFPAGGDGELIVGNSFKETTSAVMSFDGEPEFEFVVFDNILHPEVGFFRRSVLNMCLGTLELQSCWVDNLAELLNAEEIFLAQGVEGIILRHPDRPYKFGRSSVHPNQQHLMKLKRFKDAEAVVIGFEPLYHNGNETNINELGYTERSSSKEGKEELDTLGALVFDGFKIGTGFTEEERKEIWDNKDKYLNMLVKYKYQELTEDGKPRFPVFLGFRDERDL